MTTWSNISEPSFDEARRILRHLGITDLSDALLPLTTPAHARRIQQQSSLQVESREGEKASCSLAHIRLETIESLPEALRRKLLHAGHVYVISNYFRFPEMKDLQCGRAHYTRSAGCDDMQDTYPAYRLNAAALEKPAIHHLVQQADSDLALLVDVGALERITPPGRSAVTLG